ncbi:MAG: 4-hydroxy-3-methylbut-2-enyl diphosphate reductase [Lentisphaeria bacterium]|nr:4-hydroxy-3-methylbut-2-enyl diphosphate reductase [Lentisphaeria bacterium]
MLDECSRLHKKIILATHRGFCNGVARALDLVEQTITQYPAQNIYLLHQIVHNQTIMRQLQAKGIHFVENISEIPPASVVIFSAHGVTRNVELAAKAKDLTVIDATCPIVKKIHRHIRENLAQGKMVFFIGNRNHQETAGSLGQGEPGQVCLLENLTRAEKIIRDTILPCSSGVILSQTTLEREKVEAIINYVQQQLPGIANPMSICNATSQRQESVRELCGKIDFLLVFGSASSSNTMKLCAIAQTCKIPVARLDNIAELNPEKLRNVSTLGITSGASAPEYLIDEALLELKKYNFSL